jgi:L-lactate dehydrogenase
MQNEDFRSVGIVGTGWVGASVAISTLHQGVANEVILCDERKDVAEGEAMDLAHGSSFYPSASVRAGELGEMQNTDALVVCAGRGGRPNESRLDLLKDNARIASGIAEQFRSYKGIVIVVANPVDVLTRVFLETSGLEPSRVIGTGTMLDTSRLREVIGRELQLSPRSIHAHVVGEHGDSEVVLWSSARIGGTSLREWPGWSEGRESPIANEVKTAATEIIKRKGATNHAIGLVTASLVGYVLRNERRVLTVSRLQTEGDFAGVTLSLPAVVGRGGATEVITPPMTPEEAEQLQRSSNVLNDAMASIR